MDRCDTFAVGLLSTAQTPSEPVAAVDTAYGSARRLVEVGGVMLCWFASGRTCTQPVIVREYWEIKPQAQAEQAMREAMGELTDIRREFKLPLACTT